MKKIEFGKLAEVVSDFFISSSIPIGYCIDENGIVEMKVLPAGDTVVVLEEDDYNELQGQSYKCFHSALGMSMLIYQKHLRAIE